MRGAVSKSKATGKTAAVPADKPPVEKTVTEAVAKKPAAKKVLAKKASQKRTATMKAAPQKRVKTPPLVMRYAPGRLIDCEDALNEALAGLIALDAELIGQLVEVGGPPPLRRREAGFAGLAAIIVSQQVSVASANAIFGRLEARFHPLSAENLLAADEETLRACGLSTPKMKGLRALARAVVEEGLDLAALATMDALEAHRALVRVSGVGPWTADIFLLFCVGHPDAFPEGDLAMQEAARIALALETRPDARELAVIAERWRPFRGIAARLLWAYYSAVKSRSGMALADGSR